MTDRDEREAMLAARTAFIESDSEGQSAFAAGWLASRDWQRAQGEDADPAATPARPHHFVPRSGSRDERGVYRRCAVNGCTLGPEQHAESVYLSCDACGDRITADYIETLGEGDTGDYHVACTPPGMPMRTVLLQPGSEGGRRPGVI